MTTNTINKKSVSLNLLSYLKSLGVLIGFSGIILLFFDKVIINDKNYIYALITILGSTFYCIGGLLTLKLKNKRYC